MTLQVNPNRAIENAYRQGYQQAMQMAGVTKAVNITEDSAEDALKHSQQSRAQDMFGNIFMDMGLVNSLFYRQRTETDIAPYGFLSRDLQMRALATLQGNDLIQAAVSATVSKVQSTEYIIEGPQRTAKKVSTLLKASDLGGGWEQLIAKSVQDFLTTDNGMFWEIIWSDGLQKGVEQGAPSDSAYIVGIAHLDSIRCLRTGDPEYPVIYQGITGFRHKMHRTRVVFQSDMPSPAERLVGRGFCALSRCLSMSQTLVRYAAYRSELLDDVPALGLLILQNINKKYWEDNQAEFQSQREKREQNIYANLMTLFNMDPTKPADAKLIPFKSLWDNFDEAAFYDKAIDAVAMAFGLDRQELAPLANSALGSGAQSTVLASKARGKGIGSILTSIERSINLLIPTSCTFKFDFHDDDQDMQQAAIREQKSKTILSLYAAGTGGGSTGGSGGLASFGMMNSFKAAEGEVPPPTDKPAAGQTEPTPPDPFGLAGVRPPAPPPAPKELPLLTRDEARRLLAREIPEWADVITAPNPEDEVSYNDTEMSPVGEVDEPLSPALKVFADRRYGARSRYYSTGKVKVFTPRPSVSPRVTHKDVDAALDYLRKMYA